MTMIRRKTRPGFRRRLAGLIGLAALVPAATLLSAFVTAGPASAFSIGPIYGYNGMCLNVEGGSIRDGAPLDLRNCDGGWSEQWIADAGDNKIYLATDHNYCVDNTGGVNWWNNPVELWSCNSGSNQIWQHVPGGALYNPATAKCLDDPNSSTSGAQLIIYPCNGGTNQNWSFS